MPDLNPLKKVSDAVTGVATGLRSGMDGAATAVAAEAPAAGRDVVDLWVELLKIGTGASEVAPDRGDKRFSDPTWQTNPAYRAIAQGYLAGTRAVDKLTDRLEEKDYRHAQAVKFVSGIVTSALAPTNYLLGNPAALKRAFETGGKSLVEGGKNWIDDLVHNGGMPSMVRKDAFTVGVDLAVTPGAVVTRDPVAELLQYTPTTAQVHEVPTIVVPPPIGRYYFLDMAPGRSFVEYAVSQGLQMFLVSWRNPDKEHADWGIDNYVERLISAIDEVREITGSQKVNLVGFCAGGILEAITLNRLADLDKDVVANGSFAVTLLDWAGQIPMAAFGQGPTMALAGAASHRQGVFQARSMASAFTWLRPNDLVWNYWVNNYLMGQDPPAFDILAWNADGTRLPAQLHKQFLDIFHTNPLASSCAREFAGSPFDAATINVPVFVQGAITDHLTPWKGTYRTTQLVGSDDVTYVLSNAGHIASLVNPPTNPKASYFVGTDAGALDAEEWQAGSTKKMGSWWTEWVEWSKPRSGDLKDAPAELGDGAHPELAEAPGFYVRDLVPA
ncbi:MAG: alpha/beta fold hydrolase [Austwickia sp.]|jgi:polyhydroxyalkanoate synthase|nr:MAG: alpha/beta fold hydrolase [Austwickia sp.]